MSGHRSYAERRTALRRAREADPGRQARYEELRREAHHLATLSQLRRALELTQQQLAETAQLTQSSISQIEQRGLLGDLYISTLRRYIEAMGGELEIVAVFDQERIPLRIGQGTEPNAPDEVA